MKLYEIHASWNKTSKGFIYSGRQGTNYVSSTKNVIALTIRVTK